MYFKKEKRKKVNKYTHAIVCIFLVIAIVFVYSVRLFKLQVLDYDKYLKESQMSSAAVVTVDATRGEILDRYGRTIAYNREGYNVVIDYSTSSNSQINKTIIKVIDVLKQNGDEWRDKLPVSQKAPYDFTEGNNSEDVKNLKSELGVNEYAPIDDCVKTMIEDFGLENYSKATQRTLMGIRYTMLLEDFSGSYPYTIAEDISEKTKSIILESSDSFPGITVKEVSVREYADDELATHLIGTVGPIYAEDWEELKAKGYSYSDYVGKSGVELAFEDYLRGTNGINRIITNPETGETEIVTESEPVAGNSVLLTLDIDLQKKAQESLEAFMKNLRKEKIYAKSASIVCINVNNGEILASANYPSYSLTDYKENYSKLVNDESHPLFNRAFQGTYPPGSTFKPIVASIGLTVNSITKDTIVDCRQYYKYYDMTFKCMHYHGSLNVVDAIKNSCNYFFYETGKRTGITTMNEYAKLLGYGVKTGVEVPESSGTLAGPAYSESVNRTWNPGGTLLSAIGQSDNAFTPLQMATGTATIANGGTRYQSHLLREVRSYDLSEVIVEPQATVYANTGLSKEAIEIVKSGMEKAAFEGTASSVFSDYDLKIGGKTGTAESSTKKNTDNGLFISFAPYKNSEIAVAINVEHGLYGYKSASVIKEIYDQYYFAEYSAEKETDFNDLIY